MAKSFIIFVFALIFVVNICAQSPKESRTVVIDEYVFGDPKSGISGLIWAYDRIEMEFAAEVKSLNSMAFENAKKDKELADRINSINSGGGCIGNIDELLKEREKPSQEHKQKIEDGKMRWNARHLQLIAPILEKIDFAIKDFEKEKGYKVVKMSDLPEYTGFPVGYVCLDINSDKTAEFIEFYEKRGL